MYRSTPYLQSIIVAPNGLAGEAGGRAQGVLQPSKNMHRPKPKTNLPDQAPINTVPEGTTQALFFGLGSDGTVGANKATIYTVFFTWPIMESLLVLHFFVLAIE